MAFKIGDKVKICLTQSSLDGQAGEVKGIKLHYLVNDYIVLLDNIVEGYDPAIIIIGSCLEKLENL